MKQKLTKGLALLMTLALCLGLLPAVALAEVTETLTGGNVPQNVQFNFQGVSYSVINAGDPTLERIGFDGKVERLGSDGQYHDTGETVSLVPTGTIEGEVSWDTDSGMSEFELYSMGFSIDPYDANSNPRFIVNGDTRVRKDSYDNGQPGWAVVTANGRDSCTLHVPVIGTESQQKILNKANELLKAKLVDHGMPDWDGLIDLVNQELKPITGAEAIDNSDPYATNKKRDNIFAPINEVIVNSPDVVAPEDAKLSAAQEQQLLVAVADAADDGTGLTTSAVLAGREKLGFEVTSLYNSGTDWTESDPSQTVLVDVTVENIGKTFTATLCTHDSTKTKTYKKVDDTYHQLFCECGAAVGEKERHSLVYDTIEPNSEYAYGASVTKCTVCDYEAVTPTVLDDAQKAEVSETAALITSLLPEDPDSVGVDDKENVEAAVQAYDALSAAEKAYFAEQKPGTLELLNQTKAKLDERTKIRYGAFAKNGSSKYKVTIFRKGKPNKTISGDSLKKLYKKIAHINATSTVKKVTLRNNITGVKKVVPSGKYKTKTGSTVFYLDPDYIQDELEAGAYTLMATFEDGYAEETVNVDTAVYDRNTGSENHADVVLEAGEGYSFRSVYYVGPDTALITAQVTEADYTVEQDVNNEYSLILGTAFLSKLSVGQHEFTIGLTDSENDFDEDVTLTLTVTDSTSASGDNGNGGGGSGGGGGGSAANPVNLPSATAGLHGKITASPANAKAGEKVTLTLTPDEGYQVGSVTVTDKNGKAVSVTKNAGGTYSFIMPATAVTIDATFVEIQPGTDPGSGDVSDTFTDVDRDAWYHDAVQWAVDAGLMNGMGEDVFGPNETATRAMVVTMIWRLAGEPAASDPAGFSDVSGGAWYAGAVAWAAETGGVNGTSADTFSPNEPVTREQLATLLYRFAQAQGKGFTGLWAFPLDYTDAADVSEYAYEAMCWMTMNGIITGMGDGTVAPRDNATRAQIATMFMRFAEAMAQ